MARAQMELGSEWMLEEMCNAFVYGIESHIDELETSLLSDDERWSELTDMVEGSPTVQCPKGYMIVTMTHMDDHSNKITRFIKVGD